VAGGGLDVGGRADVRSGRSSDHKYVNDLTLRNRCVQYCPTHSEAVGARDRFERRSKRALPLSAPRRIVQALTGTAPAAASLASDYGGMALRMLAWVMLSIAACGPAIAEPSIAVTLQPCWTSHSALRPVPQAKSSARPGCKSPAASTSNGLGTGSRFVVESHKRGVGREHLATAFRGTAFAGTNRHRAVVFA